MSFLLDLNTGLDFMPFLLSTEDSCMYSLYNLQLVGSDFSTNLAEHWIKKIIYDWI